MACDATFIFKLRANIRLESDLALARRELEALLAAPVETLADADAVLTRLPGLAAFTGGAAVSAGTRPSGAGFLAGRGDLERLPDLARRLSFIQQVYVAASCAETAPDTLEAWSAALGPVVAEAPASQPDPGLRLFLVTPHYALMEVSESLVRRAARPEAVGPALDGLRRYLLGDGASHASALMETALRAPSTAHLSHDLHIYKAKFFPRMARSLLNIGAARGSGRPMRVLDPFAGSGTTLLEAALLGHVSRGVDFDPLSCLITQAKLDFLHISPALLADDAKRVLRRLREPSPAEEPLPGAPVWPDWLTKNRRFTPEAQAVMELEIATLRRAVAEASPETANLFRTLMSDAICRRMRFRFLGTGVGRFSLEFSQRTAVEVFAASVTRLLKRRAAWEWLRSTLHLPPAPATVEVGDARRLSATEGAFDLIVTSPPYLPASSGRESYARARTPSLLALGMANGADLDALADDAVGSMRPGDANALEGDDLLPAELELVEWLRADPLRAPKADPTGRYFLDMRRAFAEMRRTLVPGGFAAVVSGRESAFYRYATREPLRVVPVADLLAREAERSGLTVEALHDALLDKGNRNARPRSLDDYYETLIILVRPDG